MKKAILTAALTALLLLSGCTPDADGGTPESSSTGSATAAESSSIAETEADNPSEPPEITAATGDSAIPTLYRAEHWDGTIQCGTDLVTGAIQQYGADTPAGGGISKRHRHLPGGGTSRPGAHPAGSPGRRRHAVGNAGAMTEANTNMVDDSAASPSHCRALRQTMPIPASSSKRSGGKTTPGMPWPSEIPTPPAVSRTPCCPFWSSDPFQKDTLSPADDPWYNSGKDRRMTDANSALPPRQFIHRTGEKPPMKTVLCTLLCIACLMGLSACAPAPAEGPEPENSSSTALPCPGRTPRRPAPSRRSPTSTSRW